MKFTLRVTIATALLTILIATHLIALVTTQRGAAFLVRDLSDQVLQRTSDSVQEYATRLLRTASSQAALTAGYIQRDVLEGQRRDLSASDFRPALGYFREVMRVHPEISYVSLGVESTGEYCHVAREPSGALTEQECVRDARGRIRLAEFRRDGSGRRVRIRSVADSDYDPRKRPYYRLAKQAGKRAWTETYQFRTLTGDTVYGITCANPVRDAGGRLVGVASVDFTLESLDSFLNARPVGKTGFPFLVEATKLGARQVIASGEPSRVEGVPAPRDAVEAFLRKVPGRDVPKAFQTVRFLAGDTDYLGSIHPLRGGADASAPQWLLCTLVPEDEVMGRVERSINIAAAVIAAGILTGILASVVLSAGIARPVRAIVREFDRIRNLQLEPGPPFRSRIREVAQLTDGLERMKSGLRSFELFVPSDYVRWLLATGLEAKPGGQRRPVTAFFADIAGSTMLAEALSPEELIALLGDYFNAVSGEIAATGGTVDKYNGDEVMAFWNAPILRPDHARMACVAALRCVERLEELRDQWVARGLPTISARIGLCTGEVTVGTVGSDARLNYTILGDTVNVAKRIEGLSKAYGTRVLAAESTVREAGPDIVARPVDVAEVAGRVEPVLVYELLGLRGEVSAETQHFADLCGRAWDGWKRGDLAEADRLLAEAQALRPDDVAIGLCRARWGAGEGRRGAPGTASPAVLQ